MKKLFVLFLPVFTLPALGSGINSTASSAPCTNTTLETYSGNTNLQADWQPNTINLRWYNGNTLMNVQSSANTCVYDGTLTIPQTAPVRTGYTFDGWQVRPEIDFAATIPVGPEGIERWSKGETYSTHNISCHHNGHGADCNDSAFIELQVQEWKTSFNHGMLYGMSKCSAKNYTDGVASNFTDDYLDSVAGDKQYCWCRATGYKPNNSNIIYAPTSVLSWVSNGNRTVEGCASGCSNACAVYAYREYFYTALFTPRQ